MVTTSIYIPLQLSGSLGKVYIVTGVKREPEVSYL
jgi:hypothetical protein